MVRFGGNDAIAFVKKKFKKLNQGLKYEYLMH